jgi:hypothetical protein
MSDRLAAVTVQNEDGHDGAHIGGNLEVLDLLRGCFPLCSRCYTEEERAAWDAGSEDETA